MNPPTLTLAALLIFASLAAAQDMSGSYATLQSYDPMVAGSTDVEFRFYVHNGSPDTEWTADVVFTFPACFTVTGGSYDDGGLGWSFDFTAHGNSANFIDADGGYGEIYDGDGGYFQVTVDVGVGCPSGAAELHWLQRGDGWGGDPHIVEGELGFMISGTASEASSWSSVKSLYE